MDTRIIKIVEISASLPGSYKYPRKRLRVVRCQPNQKGYRNEKDVDVIWESYHFAANSKGPKSDYQKYLAKAEAIKLEHEMPEIAYTQIDGSDLKSVWIHHSIPGWIVCETQDGRLWLDTDPAGFSDHSNCSLINSSEAVLAKGKQIIEEGRNLFKVPV